MIVHVLSGWLASSYPIRRAFLQHSLRVSAESSVGNKRKSSCVPSKRSLLSYRKQNYVELLR